jgi:electron transfer flavoprotein alpha subunit
VSAPRRTRRAPAGRTAKGERQRRDPRAEREAPMREVPEAAAPRTRRDPRAERGPAVPAGGTPRLDRARPLRLVEETSAPERNLPERGPETVIIDDPACWILAVPDLDNGRLSSHDRDVLGAARGLADAHGGAVVAVTFAGCPDLDRAGADRVMYFSDGGTPAGRAAAVQAAMEQLSPRHVLFPDTAAAGGDLGRRVAARLGELPATAVQTLDAERAVSRGDGGRRDFHRQPPRVLLLAPEAAEPVAGRVHEARLMPAPAFAPVDGGIEDGGFLPLDPASVPLAEAELILSAGNGVSDWPAFHALAAALGASEAGSRPVCDAGALGRDRQVGASGTLVAARCYLALGISGAPQHLQGITDCEHVIAVNADPGAEILKRADLGVVADVQQLMPALLALLQDAEMQNA